MKVFTELVMVVVFINRLNDGTAIVMMMIAINNATSNSSNVNPLEVLIKVRLLLILRDEYDNDIFLKLGVILY